MVRLQLFLQDQKHRCAARDCSFILVIGANHLVLDTANGLTFILERLSCLKHCFIELLYKPSDCFKQTVFLFDVTSEAMRSTALVPVLVRPLDT